MFMFIIHVNESKGNTCSQKKKGLIECIDLKINDLRVPEGTCLLKLF